MVIEGGVVFSFTVVDLLDVQPFTGLVAVKVYKPPCITVAVAEEELKPFGLVHL
jgi:hypothetical protein